MNDWQRFFSKREYKDSLSKEFLTEIDEKVFEKLDGKKFFELKDLDVIENNEKYWFKIIEIEKNTGKTYQVAKKLWEIQNSTFRKIMLGRKTREEMITLRSAMNNDSKDIWPFKVGKGNNLYDKESGRHCGRMFYLKGAGMTPFASNQFPDYTDVVVDEYQAVKEDKELTQLVREFIIFLLNVKRDKPEIQVLMLGNTYSLFDPFRLYFKTPYDKKFLKDEKRGVLILNLAKKYKGVDKKGGVYDLLDYDNDLKNFVDGSTSFDNIGNILPIPMFKKLKIAYQIVINREAFAVFWLKNGIAIKAENNIYSKTDTFCASLKDLALVPNGYIISPKENFEIGEELIYYISDNAVLYDTPETLNKITAFFNIFVSKYNDYLGVNYGEI